MLNRHVPMYKRTFNPSTGRWSWVIDGGSVEAALSGQNPDSVTTIPPVWSLLRPRLPEVEDVEAAVRQIKGRISRVQAVFDLCLKPDDLVMDGRPSEPAAPAPPPLGAEAAAAAAAAGGPAAAAAPPAGPVEASAEAGCGAAGAAVCEQPLTEAEAARPREAATQTPHSVAEEVEAAEEAEEEAAWEALGQAAAEAAALTAASLPRLYRLRVLQDEFEGLRHCIALACADAPVVAGPSAVASGSAGGLCVEARPPQSRCVPVTAWRGSGGEVEACRRALLRFEDLTAGLLVDSPVAAAARAAQSGTAGSSHASNSGDGGDGTGGAGLTSAALGANPARESS